MEKRSTITDVAAAAQVSTGTVHRALYGKPGVSDAVRQKIIAIAHEMGYQPNQVASSLKKKPLRIVVAFPAPAQDNRFFYGELWNGYRGFRREMQAYNCDLIESPFSCDGVNDFSLTMKRILRQYSGEIDGVITGGKMLANDLEMVNRLSQNEIPVVIISENAGDARCLCCVQSDHATDGRMAAELLTAQIPDGAGILMCAGDVLLPSNCENTAGFEQFLRENNKKNPLVRLYGFEETEGVPERVLDTLKNEPDIRGLYSVSARCTLYLAQAVEKLDLKGKVRLIGSDLYPESVRYLKEGIIDIIIHKNPHYQVTVGLKHLLSYLTRREEPALKDERLTSVIVCRSNVDKYLH